MPSKSRGGSKRRHDGDTRDNTVTGVKAVTHDWEKDEEEVELEARLFGTSKKRKNPPAEYTLDLNGDGVGEGDGDGHEGELGGLDDSELFTIDAPIALPSENEDEDEEHRVTSNGRLQGERWEGDGSDSDSESVGSGSDSDSAPSFTFHERQSPSPSLAPQSPTQLTKEAEPSITFPSDLVDLPPSGKDGAAKKNGKQKMSVWTDPADENLIVDMENDRRMKKMARGKTTKVVGGKELEKRLREQFERLHPRPSWASQRTVSGTPSLTSLLSSTKSFIASSGSDSSHPSHSLGGSGPLPSGTIDLHRLLNANHQNPTTGKREASNAGSGVVDVTWHPSSRIGVMAVAGGDRRVRFFNIDGHTNPTLLTIHLPSLPLTRTTFHPSGSCLLLTGTRPYYYTYDLASSRCIRSPRNLFGSTPSPTSPNSLTRHAFSPDGSLLAVAGRRGAVSILDWSGSGVGAVMAELKGGRGGTVVDVQWSNDGHELSVLGGGDGAQVEVWDVGMRKVVRRWRDDRAFGGMVLSQSRDQQYTAIGSSTGIVNLYSTTSLRTPTPFKSLDISPTPIKSLGHLTTPISTVTFHPNSELMVTASSAKKGQLRLYHLPSCTAYSNWPTPTTPLGRVTTASFSTGGEYLATGNQRGNVLLYSVKHYANL